MNVLSEIKDTIKYWWIYMLVGVLFILGSIYIFSNPAESYLSLSLFFAFMILVDGIGSVILSISSRKVMEGWGWQLASGILSTMIGLSLLVHPELSLAILPLFVGFWVLLKGSFLIGVSFDLKKVGTDGWGWTLFLGVMTVLFGLAMVMNPVIGASMVLSFTAIGFLFIGLAILFISLKLRNFKKGIEKVKEFSKDKMADIKKSLEKAINEDGDIKSALKEIRRKMEDAFD
jgi:uncharacterized membrane protein HdeD (DUF308 family)